MRYKILISIILYCFVISCVDLGNDKKYKEYIKYFEQQHKGITSHFPLEYKNITKDYAYNVDTTAYFNTLSFNITITDEKEIKKIIKTYQNEEKYKKEDHCIIVVNDFIKKNNIPFISSEDVLLSEDMHKKNITYFSDKCLDDYKILPNFWSNTYGSDTYSVNGLNDNFEYIILEMKKGDEIYSKKLKSDVSYMPDFAKHGYSKGIAINEKEHIVIYWLVFW